MIFSIPFVCYGCVKKSPPFCADALLFVYLSETTYFTKRVTQSKCYPVGECRQVIGIDWKIDCKLTTQLHLIVLDVK